MNDQEKQSYIAHLRFLAEEALQGASKNRLYADDPLDDYYIGVADGLKKAITLLEKA